MDTVVGYSGGTGLNPTYTNIQGLSVTRTRGVCVSRCSTHIETRGRHWLLVPPLPMEHVLVHTT